MARRNHTHYTKVFIETNGPGPWTCYGCGEPIPSEKLCVHHLDEDETNDDPSNLASMHLGCHVRLHHKGKTLSPETRQRVSDSKRGVVFSPEHRRKISEARLGKPCRQPRFRCSVCPMESTGFGLAMHQKASGHQGREKIG